MMMLVGQWAAHVGVEVCVGQVVFPTRVISGERAKLNTTQTVNPAGIQIDCDFLNIHMSANSLQHDLWTVCRVLMSHKV